MMASSCMAGCCFGGTEPSVAQEGVTDLPQRLRALCDLGDCNNLQRAVFGQSYGPGDSWWAQASLCFAEVTEKSEKCPQQSSQQNFTGHTKCCVVPSRMELWSQMGL